MMWFSDAPGESTRRSQLTRTSVVADPASARRDPCTLYNSPCGRSSFSVLGRSADPLSRQLAAADVAVRVILVDDAGQVAAGKALDICQPAPVDRYSTNVLAPRRSVVVGADAIVLADRYAGPNGEFEAMQVFSPASGSTSEQAALLLCAGSRQLSVIEQGVRETGIPAQRLIGSAPRRCAPRSCP